MLLDLYIDTQNRGLVNPDGTPFEMPALMQGDTINMVLHGIRRNPVVGSFIPWIDDPISFTQIKAAIGYGADKPAISGTFRVRLVGQSVGTDPLPVDISQADFAKALNDLQSVKTVSAQGMSLDTVDDQAENFFYIRWVDPTITTLFEVYEARLEPTCFVRSIPLTLATGQVQMLKMIVAPLAFTGAFAYPPTAEVGVELVRTGTNAQNCVQSVEIPANATGSFSLTFATNATTILPCSQFNTKTDASAALAAALNGIWNDGQIRFSVSMSATGVYYVEFIGALGNAPFDLLQKTMYDQQPSDTPTASIALDGPEIEFALRGQPKIELVFELEITDGNGVTTPVQVPLTITNDMIDAAMNVASDPNWLVPSGPDYPPYDPGDATILAAPGYATGLGSGVGVAGTNGYTFVITHNLNTEDVIIEVVETGGLKRELASNLYVREILNANQVQISFANVPNVQWDTPPAPGQYRVLIQALSAVSMALPHHTHPISDIIGLQDILNSLENGQNADAPIDVNRLPDKIPWQTFDSSGKPTGYRFDQVPDALLPPDVVRLGADGTIPIGELPPGIPVWSAGPPAGLYLTLPDGTSKQITDANGNIVVSALPTDVSQWAALAPAILAQLQAGAQVPRGMVPMIIAPFKEDYPAQVAGIQGRVAPASLPQAVEGFTAAPDPGTISGDLPDPEDADENVVYTVSKGATALPISGGHRGIQRFADGTKIVCDGKQWFPVFIDGLNAFPIEMERELFTARVSANMMPLGSQFQFVATIYLALTGKCAIYSRGQYNIRLQTGVIVAPALKSITWTDVLNETVLLSSASVGHTIGFSVTRPKQGDATAKSTLYGVDTAVTPPANFNFILRASLTHFDLEDQTDQFQVEEDDGEAPVGQVSVSVPSPAASVALLQ